MGFQIVRPADDVADIFQIQRSGFIQDLEQEPGLLIRTEHFVRLGVKAGGNRVAFQTDGHDDVFCDNNA